MKYVLAAAAMFAATACADSTAPTLRPGGSVSDVDANQTTPSAYVTQNPCNGDVVPLLGDTHILIHITQSTSGNQHVYVDFTSNYTGTGEPSGVKYNASTRTLNDFSTQDPFPIVFYIYQDEQVNSSTGVDNFTSSVQFKVTINSNGVPTATVDNQKAKCNG
jgi:hypothetical protein